MFPVNDGESITGELSVFPERVCVSVVPTTTPGRAFPKTVLTVKTSMLFILIDLSPGILIFSDDSQAFLATLYVIDLSVVPFRTIPPPLAPASVGDDVCPRTMSLS